MKIYHYTLILIFTLLSFPTVAEDESESIKWIRDEYKITRTNIDDYTKHEFSFLGESTEGAGGIGYISDKDEIRLIEVTYYGEMGKSHYEFYYSKGVPIFVLAIDYSYNTHIMMSEKIAKEWFKEDGVMPEVFEPNKTTKEEWRYYFHDGVTIRIIGPGGSKITDSENAKEILETSAKNYKRLNNTLKKD